MRVSMRDEEAIESGRGRTVKQMEEELRLAGWKSKGRLVWVSPAGGLFRGPYGAWKVMRNSK